MAFLTRWCCGPCIWGRAMEIALEKNCKIAEVVETDIKPEVVGYMDQLDSSALEVLMNLLKAMKGDMA